MACTTRLGRCFNLPSTTIEIEADHITQEGDSTRVVLVSFHIGCIGLVRVVDAGTTVERIVSKQFIFAVFPSLHLLFFVGGKMPYPVRNL